MSATEQAHNPKAKKLALGSLFTGIAANVAGIATGIIMPMTTEQGMLVTQTGYNWPHRVWTHATRVAMWTGLSTTFALVAVSLLLGLWARHLYERSETTKPGQANASDPTSLVLRPARDLGMIVALLAPVAAFFAESISMAIVQSGG